jgi:uncharacterized membrane protein YfcA
MITLTLEKAKTIDSINLAIIGSPGPNDAAEALGFSPMPAARRRRHPNRPAMTALTSLSLGVLGLFTGLLIGAVGIGVVILVPALVPIHATIAAAMMSYLLTGLIGTLVYAGENSIRWSKAAIVLVVVGAAIAVKVVARLSV